MKKAMLYQKNYLPRSYFGKKKLLSTTFLFWEKKTILRFIEKY